MRHFVVGPYHEQYPSLVMNWYRLLRKKANDFAVSIDRELAEGPTVYFPNNYFGPVELWPLVFKEDEVC